MPLTEFQKKWLKDVLKVDVNFAEVAVGDSDKEFLARSKGAEHEGEEARVGWRATRRPDETEEEHAARANETYIVTKHFTDEERKAATVKPDAQGIVKTAEGKAAEGHHTYAVDAQTGEMVVGNEGYTVKDTESGAEQMKRGFTPDRKSARESDGKLVMESEHHSSMLRGADVASAGMVDFKDGKVAKISNSSGHYRPRFEHLLQVVEDLMRSGAMLDTEIVNYKGEVLKDTDPKAFAAWKKVQGLQAGLAEDAKAIRETVTGLTESAPTPEAENALEKALKGHEARVDLVSRATAALREMGIGPRNQMTGIVELTYAAQEATGQEFRTAKTKTMSADRFLRGEGAPAVEATQENKKGPPAAAAAKAEPYMTDAPPQQPANPTTDPWRDHKAKGAMLGEFEKAAEQGNLRPSVVEELRREELRKQGKLKDTTRWDKLRSEDPTGHGKPELGYLPEQLGKRPEDREVEARGDIRETGGLTIEGAEEMSPEELAEARKLKAAELEAEWQERIEALDVELGLMEASMAPLPPPVDPPPVEVMREEEASEDEDREPEGEVQDEDEEIPLLRRTDRRGGVVDVGRSKDVSKDEVQYLNEDEPRPRIKEAASAFELVENEEPEVGEVQYLNEDEPRPRIKEAASAFELVENEEPEVGGECPGRC